MTNPVQHSMELRGRIRPGKLFLAAGISDARSARLAREGGADISIVYHFGKHPTKRHSLVLGMMPFGNANQIVRELGADILPEMRGFPVLAGVCATDPFRRIDCCLDEFKQMGFFGVHNYPTVGLIDGNMRGSLELNEMGYRCETEMIRMAAAASLPGCAFVFSEKEAKQMARAGAEAVIIHMGLVTQRMIAEGKGPTLGQAAALIRKVSTACRKINPGILVLCHGYPIESIESVAFLLSEVPELDGYLDLFCFSGQPDNEVLQRMKALSELAK